MSYRDYFLVGECPCPIETISKYVELESHEIATLEDMWQDLWNNRLMDKETPTVFYAEQFGDMNKFNKVLSVLGQTSWVESTISNNFAMLYIREDKILKVITAKEWNNVKFTYKFNAYKLKVSIPFADNIVKLNNSWEKTGIIRKGFMKAGRNKFKFDGKYVQKYAKYISYNIYKDMVSLKEITYNEITNNLIEWYAIADDEYTLGQCIADSRGRAIYQCTKKIGNPISSKDMRACIVTKPQHLDNYSMNRVYAFISELLGIKCKTFDEKIMKGVEAYKKRTLPDFDAMLSVTEFSDLHALIWLERIYENLDNYNNNNWVVPIEMDATASMLQIMGILTNNHEYMKLTNLIYKNELHDAWTLDYCSRTHAKKAATPHLYGSNASPKELWDKNKLEYTQEMINKITDEMRIGRFAAADNFKDFIITNVKPTEEMTVKVWNDIFKIKCNKTKPEKIKTQEYWIYTSSQNKCKRVTRNIEYVPDLEQFKRYFVTLLVHGCDSQISNNIAYNMDWVLPNHDAWIINPADCKQLEDLYLTNIKNLYNNRKEILSEYFKSINITEKWEDIDTEIEEFSAMCLK